MRRGEALGILSAHRDELRGYGVKSLALFGSVARDDAGADSDIDVLVEFAEPVGLFQFVDLKEHLEDMLGCRVDLATPGSLTDRIRASVLKDLVHVG